MNFTAETLHSSFHALHKVLIKLYYLLNRDKVDRTVALVMTGYLMHLPVVFIKKKEPKTVDDAWKSWVWSFTRGDETTVCIDRKLLTENDRILFIDDFLADGHASGSVIHFCRQSGAQIVGMGFLVEKGFSQGGQFLRDHNINYHALATVTRINEDNSFELA